MANFRQIWRTTSANETVTFSLAPGSYFGPTATDCKIGINWGDGSIDNITITDTSITHEASHVFTTPGDHSVHVFGGWTDDLNKNRSAFDGRRVLAYPILSDRTGNETPHKLIMWLDNNSFTGQPLYSTRLQPWQKDSNGDPLTDPATGQDYVGPEIVRQRGFWCAGLGSFKDYTNMRNWPQWVYPILSDDPTTPSATSYLPWQNRGRTVIDTSMIDMSECFMNCAQLVGDTMWTFRAWAPRDKPDVGPISNLRACFKNAIKSTVTTVQRGVTVGRKRVKQTFTSSDGTTTLTRWVVTDPGTTTYYPVAGTDRTVPVFAVHTWGTNRCTSMESCFDNCGARFLHLQRWRTDACTNINYMFRDCHLERLIIGRNGVFGAMWDLSNVTSARGAFQGVVLDDLDVWRDPSGRTVSQKRNSDWVLLKDFPLLNITNITDYTDMFRDSNMNPDLSQWNVANAVEFGGFRVGGTMIDEHVPAFQFPQADVEVEDFTGDQHAQYVTVSTEHASKWSWAVNGAAENQQNVSDTTVQLNNMRLGLNTLGLSAYDEEGNLDDEEFNYVLAMTAVQVENVAITIEDMVLTDTTLDIEVNINDATLWQYSVQGTSVQNVIVAGNKTRIYSLPYGMNTILLSALDSNADYIGETKTIVNVCDPNAGGTTTGGTSGATFLPTPSEYRAGVGELHVTAEIQDVSTTTDLTSDLLDI